MSKYNNVKSIPIESIPIKEIKRAIKEWAENDEAMERLLWSCYNNNIKTDGCHAGSYPYISFEHDQNYESTIINLMNTALLSKESQIIIRPYGTNPFSGPNWDKPNLLIGYYTLYQDVADKEFDILTNVINNKNILPTKIEVAPLFELLNFLITNCYTRILFRIVHTKNDSYIFSIERSLKENSELYQFLNNILPNMGFNLIKPIEGVHVKWSVTTTDHQELNEKLKETVKQIINNYSVKTPTNIEDTDDFITKAHIIRNRSLDEFNIWIAQEEQKRNEMRKKARHHK